LKPRTKLGHTTTPDGSDVTLHQHDKDYIIEVNRHELMSSRRSASETALGQLGCKHLTNTPTARVLIGGLGMGFTLRAALNTLPSEATVIVAELLPEVIRWNREIIGHLSSNALDDKRVEVVTGDVYDLLKKEKSRFNAVLLDIDNGPKGATDTGNDKLYTKAGLQIIKQSLLPQGRLGLWSSSTQGRFKTLLEAAGYMVNCTEIPAYPGAKSKSHFVWFGTHSNNS
jgi:spermidine synthase